MRSNKPSFEWAVALAIITLTLLATATRASAQQETILYNFPSYSTDGLTPSSSLIFDAAGNLYGTTAVGGAYNEGTVFELTPAEGGGWTETLPYIFGTNSEDGTSPGGGLIFDKQGNLYGVTSQGGMYNLGTVFELAPAAGGAWTETLLHTFNQNGTDGCIPTGGLIFDNAGKLYGTTTQCGLYGHGTVFELTSSSTGWTETELRDFNGKDGAFPGGSLIFDAAGNLYGTTLDGGLNNNGSVFELTPSASGHWSEKVLHNFAFNGTDGAYPRAGLVFDSAGNLWGTTSEGGPAEKGAVFELMPPTSAGGQWKEILHYFHGPYGAAPESNLIFDAAGALYGTTNEGGADNYGTVFQMSREQVNGPWKETVLHSFDYNGTDGFFPSTGLILDAKGNLYGTAYFGGTFFDGIVFEITP